MQNARNLPEPKYFLKLKLCQLKPTSTGDYHEPECQPHSSAWVTFTYASFSASAFMVAIGVYFLPLDLWEKGYLSMGIVMLVQSCVILTKTVRDMHESGKLVNRIEDAKAERILMDFNKAA